MTESRVGLLIELLRGLWRYLKKFLQPSVAT